jgi:hypothetical protein
MGGRPFCFTNTGLSAHGLLVRPFKKIATSRAIRSNLLAAPKGFPLLSRLHGRQTVLRYQHGALPTACLYGLLENCDQPGCMGEQRFCFAKS